MAIKCSCLLSLEWFELYLLLFGAGGSAKGALLLNWETLPTVIGKLLRLAVSGDLSEPPLLELNEVLMPDLKELSTN